MTKNRAARLGGGLFVVSGLLTLVNNYAPGSENLDIRLLNLVGAIAVTLGAAVWFAIPWERLPLRATLVIPAVALPLVGTAVAKGGVSGQTFGAFFILIAAYVGATQPRWTMVWFSIPMSVTYVLAALARPDGTFAEVTSVSVVVPVAILVGEVLAGALASAGGVQAQADRRAELLAAVARSARSVSAVDSSSVMRAVADTSLALGYSGVSIEVFDREQGTYRCVEARGLPPEFTDSLHTSDQGVTGEVLRQRAQVVMDDYSQDLRSLASLSGLGFRVVIGTPIWSGSRMLAVLNVGTTSTLSVEPAELEALVLLADQAGHALDLAEAFEQQRSEAQRYRRDSMVDPLSGIGSRRHADEIIETARAGDALLLIDLDDFKRVNDEHGHAAGDVVVSGLGGFLRTRLRAGDEAARYGGDEFVIVLRRPGVELVEAVERLRTGWMATEPAAMFSVGTATVRRDEPPRAALDRADAALRIAKTEGKNRAGHADLVPDDAGSILGDPRELPGENGP